MTNGFLTTTTTTTEKKTPCKMRRHLPDDENGDVDDERHIRKLIKAGKSYYLNCRFDDARAKFDAALSLIGGGVGGGGDALARNTRESIPLENTNGLKAVVAIENEGPVSANEPVVTKGTETPVFVNEAARPMFPSTQTLRVVLADCICRQADEVC